ncbi:MAG TPA: NF038122 family metalloprotease, partial [Bryobacteraceae bacterium]|nr:NF038122 family metalloprotease [Bryobacteraceae bacterium]
MRIQRPTLRGLVALAAAASSLFSQPITSQVALGRGPSARLQTGGFEEAGASLHIYGPGVIAIDTTGNAYVAVNDGVFKIGPSGVRARVAGTERHGRYSGDGGPAILAGLNPRSVALDTEGNLYLADESNNRIRKVTIATGIVTTVAGNGVKGFLGDGGGATNARLDGPTGVALDPEGNFYIADGTADGHNRIRRVGAATGVITTVAGNGSQGYSGDGGPATSAQLSSLGGLAADASGNLYIADNFNHRVRMVSLATGIITTVAGSGIAGSAGDGGPAASAELNNPLSVAVDTAGDVYIADSGNYRIRKVTIASGMIDTAWNGNAVYRNASHSFPCAIALDAAGNLYIADSGISQLRRVPADALNRAGGEADAPAIRPARNQGTSNGLKINVTYDTSVPAAARTAFDSVVSAYESAFSSNITVNIDVTFGATGLGASSTQQIVVSYSAWRAAMIANANANPGNTYAVAAAASLPENDPIGNGEMVVNTANARALGLTANAAVDSTLTFSNTAVFEYDGVATSGAADFLDVAAHELDEGLGIGSALTGLINNAPVPSGYYAAEDYFRYSAASTHDITTNPTAVVYFSYDGGNTNLAQFNQKYSALGDSNLDRNDWVYGDFGCPAATVHIQDAILCDDQAIPVGTGPEITVLDALGYDSSLPSVPAVVSVTPSSGSGSSQTFALQYSDTAGAGNLSFVYAWFTTTVTGNGSSSCLLSYQPSTNQL